METIAINSMYWESNNPTFTRMQATVFEHFNLSLSQHKVETQPGQWIDSILKTQKADIYVFFDVDCVPITKDAVEKSIEYVAKTGAFIGLAQASNHIYPKTHIFATWNFFCLHRALYERLGKPSFVANFHGDVAENFCYVAENAGVRYKALFPLFYEKESTEGLWRLHNYGFYGISNVFENNIYHFSQSRTGRHIDLFQRRCEQIIEGTFDTKGMIPCSSFYPPTGFKVAN